MMKRTIPPEIEELRRTQKVIKRQIHSSSNELEAIVASQRHEILDLKRIKTELNKALQERTAASAHANDT